MFVADGTVTVTTTTFLGGLALSLPGGQAGTGVDANGTDGVGIGGQGGAIATSDHFESLSIRFSRLVDNRAAGANGSNGAGGTIFIFQSNAAQAEDN
jgi:hypothetical protein